MFNLGNISSLLQTAVSDNTTNIGPEGPQGEIGPANPITVTDNGDGTITVSPQVGTSVTTGDLTGTGISTITKTSTLNNIDTYTITMDDSSTSTFEVVNGVDGYTPVKGTDYVDGKSMYDIAVDEGFVGNESDWLATIKGPTGDTGAVGATGPAGIQGVKGDTGPKGDTGYAVDGVDGIDGTNGIDGVSITVDNITNNSYNDSITIDFSDGTSHTTDPLRGSIGIGISSITLAQQGGYSQENVYDINLTDGTSSEFRVMNGDNILSVEPVNVSSDPGHENIYKVVLSDGTVFPISTFNGSDGTSSAASVSSSTSDVLKELYAVSYTVADSTALGAVTGMVTGELAYQTDTDEFYEFDGTSWVIKTDFTISAGASSSGTYTNTDLVPTTIGGILAGDSFNAVSYEDMFTSLLYPYQYPAFTSFSISGQSTTLEVGDSVTAGSKTFNWGTSNSGNVTVSSISIKDSTSGNVLVSSSANDGTEDATLVGITNNVATSNTWRIEATNTNAGVFSRNYSVNWYWAIYYGESALTSLLEADIEGLRVKELKASSTKSYAMNAGDYKWICYPTAMGLKSTFVDTATNFDVAMNPVETVNITNSFGIATDYYCHRTYNVLGATITIAVS